jgi:hypothetical protein
MQKSKAPVSLRALVQRINRKLVHENEQLKATRGDRWRHEQGDYYIVDHSRRWIVAKHVDVEELGRELGVLAEFEAIRE